jgi:two-component system chemotaxis sensor kinase CheA
MAGPSRNELREIFRDEVADLAEVLENALATLSSDRDARDEDRSAAITEVYRVVHSLKGAARAVDLPAAEALLHEAEGLLGPARYGDRTIAAEVLRVGGIVLDAVRAMHPTLDRGAGPDRPLLERFRQALHGEAAAARETHVPEEPKPEAETRPSTETVRVGATRLDELVVAAEGVSSALARADGSDDHAAISALTTDARTEIGRARLALRPLSGADEALGALDRALGKIAEIGARIGARRTAELREGHGLRAAAEALSSRARALRLARLSSLTPALQRTADGAAQDSGREVVLVFSQFELEVDRRVVEGLREPLLHLVRNAVAHGIEPPDERITHGKARRGRLAISAWLRGRDLEIVIEDDGRGLDPDRLRAAAVRAGHPSALVERIDPYALSFLPGVTTRGEADALAGRGVGLDVVRARIAAMHGRIDVVSSPGRGARFTIHVPADLRMLRAIVARVRDLEIAIVTTAIERLVRIPARELVEIEGRAHLPRPSSVAVATTDGLDGSRANAPVPLADLADVLGVDARAGRGDRSFVVALVIAVAERRIALAVDALVDERELVVAPLGERIRRVPYVAGATVGRDGDVVLVLDAAALLRDAHATSGPLALHEATPSRPRILVVDDSLTTRQLERSILEGAGYEVVLAVDGQQGWELLSAADAAFDAVVSDVEMPRLDGFGLLARARATPALARLPIVLVTALAHDEGRRRAVELGASAYIVKGRFDQGELLDVLEGLL